MCACVCKTGRERFKPACPKNRENSFSNSCLRKKSWSEALDSISGWFKSGKKCRKLAKFVLQTLEEQKINLSRKKGNKKINNVLLNSLFFIIIFSVVFYMFYHSVLFMHCSIWFQIPVYSSSLEFIHKQTPRSDTHVHSLSPSHTHK